MMSFLSQVQPHPFPRRVFGRTGCQPVGVHSLNQTPPPHIITTDTCATVRTVTTPTPTKTKRLAQCLVIAMATMDQAPPTHQVQGQHHTCHVQQITTTQSKRNGEGERGRERECVSGRERERERWRGIDTCSLNLRERGKEREGETDKQKDIRKRDLERGRDHCTHV